jgi:hypothetical protein
MNKMKKTVLCFVLIVGFVMSLSSCLFLIPKTFKMTVDDNISEDQIVKITFGSGGNAMFIVREWNSKKIAEEIYRKKFISTSDRTILTVPAGSNSFTFDLDFIFSNQQSSTTYTFKGIELRYDLESGKEYQVKGTAKSLGFFKGFEFYVGIYDKKGDTLLKEWKLGAS